MQSERLFTPFLDAVDGTLCLPASSSAANIYTQTAPHRLRFPLLICPQASLREQVAATTHAPAASRFGPYCDNILGINWRLPDGRIARIGERVAKTTTGYDWLRFLLHSGRRFGEPLDYVIRLRPDCGFDMEARFEGTAAALHNCMNKLLLSGWMHWWDAVDFIAEGDAACVRVAIHCPMEEAPIFERQLALIASETSALLSLRQGHPPTFDGLPDIVIKTTPDRAIALATGLASEVLRCVTLCYSGVVHLYLHEGAHIAEQAHSLMQPHIAELHAVGGDWHSRWLPASPPHFTESRWIETLERTIHAP